MRACVLLGSLLFFSAPAGAESSNEYAQMGQKVWPAYSCSIAAELANKTEEAKRLFTVGYNNGITFLNALKEGKVKREDVSSRVAMGLLLRLDGMSSDFIMGRNWEAASENFYDEMNQNCEGCILDDQRTQIYAENLFRKGNCVFLK